VRCIAPPEDAEPVTDAEGAIIGWIRLREPVPGNPILPGFDVYKAAGPNACIPWRNLPISRPPSTLCAISARGRVRTMTPIGGPKP
jgi:hypothetical protein